MPAIRLGAARIGRSFGAVQALRDVSFNAQERTIHALLGENGAGKTTLIRSLSGLDRPDTGSVVVHGKPVVFKGPRDAFAAGVAVVQQELAMSPHLTLMENLVLGIEPVRAGRIDWRGARARAQEIADSMGAELPWDKRANEVGVGTRQQLEIVRCLFRGADTLIFDEPSAALAPSQIEGLLNQLKRLREQGNTIILITHKLDEALAVADDVTVLRAGQVVHSQAASGLDAAALARMIVGADMEAPRIGEAPTPGDPVLVVDQLKVAGRRQPIGPVSFEVRAGEILGIAGVAGNGQEELVDALVGLRPVASGAVSISGADVTRATVGQRRASGLAYISPDRRDEGLSVTESLIDNVVIGTHRRPPVARRGWISPRRARTYAEAVLTEFDVRHGSSKDPASSLSGGNQQKVVFGREMTMRPSLLVAAQPTRGVDIRGIASLHRVMRDARDRGVATVLVSQELDELLALSNRVLVMYHGQLAGVFDPRQDDAKNAIGVAMLGTTAQEAS